MSGPVTIRRATADDAELIFAWRNEPAAQRYQPLRTLSLARVRQNLSDRAALELGPHVSGELQWIIVAAARPVGWITLRVHNREHGVGELGYTVGSAYHRRGVASAAVQLILPVAFGATTGTNLWRLEAQAAVDNGPSRKVLEGAGFRLEGIARASAIIGGVRVDHARYGLLRTDWNVTRDPDPR